MPARIITKANKKPRANSAGVVVLSTSEIQPYQLSAKLVKLTSNRSSAESLLKKAGILDNTGELAVQYAR